MLNTDTPAPGFFKCEKTRCDLCENFFVNSNTFSSAQTGKTYFLQQRLSCNSTKVVYLVHCIKCNLQYVGSITTELKVRFRNHKSSMKTNNKTCEVAIHTFYTHFLWLYFSLYFTKSVLAQIMTQTNYWSPMKHTGARNYFLLRLLDQIKDKNFTQKIAFTMHKTLWICRARWGSCKHLIKQL